MHLNAASEPQSLLSLSPIPPAQNFPWFWTALIAWSSASLVTSTHKRICIPKGAPAGWIVHAPHACAHHTSYTRHGAGDRVQWCTHIRQQIHSMLCCVPSHHTPRQQRLCVSQACILGLPPGHTRIRSVAVQAIAWQLSHSIPGHQLSFTAAHACARPTETREGPISPSTPQRCCYMIYIAS